MTGVLKKTKEDPTRGARETGDSEDPPGPGEPLLLEDDRHIPEDLRLAYKILKNAECLPPEVELRKDIEKTEDLLAALPDTATTYQLLKKLNFLILKLNAMRQTSVANDIPQHYTARLLARMEAGGKQKQR